MSTMMSHSFATMVLLVLFVGALYSGEVSGDHGLGGLVSSTVAEQREFDYFALALQWPPTFCSKSTKCCATNGCCRGANSPSVFTIHGLWPDYNDGTWPSCCSGPEFDANEISTLQDTLDKYWPVLSCSNFSTCHSKKGVFWAHEWEKHGTCASPVTGDQYNYFITTINLSNTYNVTGVLFEAGYVPSNSEKYPGGGIIAALENAFHATPQITCLKGALEEVRLCLTKDFKFRDCVDASNCPDYVSLPEWASSDSITTAGRLFPGYQSL